MKVFLSYSSGDQAFVDRLRVLVERAGVSVFDPAGTSPGEGWSDVIRRKLTEADAIVLVAPEPGSPGANNAVFEAGAAQAMGKPVVAVLPGSVAGREVPYDLRAHQVVGNGDGSVESVADSLMSSLRAA